MAKFSLCFSSEPKKENYWLPHSANYHNKVLKVKFLEVAGIFEWAMCWLFMSHCHIATSIVVVVVVAAAGVALLFVTILSISIKLCARTQAIAMQGVFGLICSCVCVCVCARVGGFECIPNWIEPMPSSFVRLVIASRFWNFDFNSVALSLPPSFILERKPAGANTKKSPCVSGAKHRYTILGVPGTQKSLDFARANIYLMSWDCRKKY